MLHITPIEDGDMELFYPEVPLAQGEQVTAIDDEQAAKVDQVEEGATDEVVEAIELAAEVDELVVAAGEQVVTTDEQVVEQDGVAEAVADYTKAKEVADPESLCNNWSWLTFFFCWTQPIGHFAMKISIISFISICTKSCELLE